jgi:hypothetical protein
VLRIGIGMQQGDRNRLSAGVQHRVDGAVDGVHIEARYHSAVSCNALHHLDYMAPLHQRLRFVDVQVIGFVSLLAADDQNVAEALRRD